MFEPVEFKLMYGIKCCFVIISFALLIYAGRLKPDDIILEGKRN